MSNVDTACEVCGVAVDEPSVRLIEGNFSRIRVRAQDVVVVRSKFRLSQEQKKNITDVLRQIFPTNKVVILDEGLEIGVMAPVRDEDCDEDEGDA